MTSKPEAPGQFVRSIEWGKMAPLRLRARSVAEGVYAGSHRSRRRGPGVEFGGHRPYVPGDDLRWIDRHALMRHDRLIVREFETETDRGLHLLVDATASMGFRGNRSDAAKVAFGALLAAALARVALSAGDPVSLDWFGGTGTRSVAPSSAGDAFERIVGALSSIGAAGDVSADERAFERALQPIARRARRGAVVVFVSDLLDLMADAPAQYAALAAHGRTVIALQVLDPDELSLPYSGTVRLRSVEGESMVETDADVTRERYIAALDELTRSWSQPLAARGGRLVRSSTDADPVDVVRAVLRAIAEGPP